MIMKFLASRHTAVAFVVLCLTVPEHVRAEERREIAHAPLSKEIAGREVAFLAQDLETGAEIALEGSDVDKRHTPWSTFKIPNLLIALESGAASSLDHDRAWDRNRRPAARYWPETWRRDHTLRSAFKHSAVWYFRDVALDVGSARYRTCLSRWHYGNAQVAKGSDRFWLDRTLKISVGEQVEFLAALLDGKLNVTPPLIDALMAASFASETDGFALHGKTGAGPVDPGKFSGAFEGWYVGFIRRAGRKPVVFALYTKAPSFKSLRTFRKDFAVRLLKEANFLPRHFPD